jgi:hypothetical protein
MDGFRPINNLLDAKMKSRAKKNIILTLAVLIFLVLAWALSPLYLPWKVLYWGELRSGDRIILNIENFRAKYNRLPQPEKTDEVLPLGFELRVGYYPDYKLIKPGEYELEYSFGFDGPNLRYSSLAKQWTCELCN